MIVQFAIAVVCVLAAGSVHFLALRTAARTLRDRRAAPYPSLIALLLTGTFGQCCAAFLFACGYAISIQLDLGSLKPTDATGFAELFSFSLVNLTTLGLGDVTPQGHLKLLAGIEAMTGFLLITCSASHVFQIMRLDQS